MGLRGTVRRVWGRRGVPIRQRVQFTYEWRYLFVVVNGRAGRVHWAWLPDVKAASIAAVVGGLGPGPTQVDAVVWDRAPGHSDKRMRPFAQARGISLLELPPYSPELNPAERLIEEIRRTVEGRVYASLDDKVAAVEAFLTNLDADPDRVRRLAAWNWIEQALDSLPASPAHLTA